MPEPPICDCPDWPVVLWHLADGSWVVGAVIDPQADPQADWCRFTQTGGRAWVCMCPGCGLLYDAGEASPI